MQHNNIEALFYNIQTNTKPWAIVDEKSNIADSMVEALGLSFEKTDDIRCAVAEYASISEMQGFSWGFKAAVDLIFSGGVGTSQPLEI